MRKMKRRIKRQRMLDNLDIGDVVEWQSHAGCKSTTKRGVVVYLGEGFSIRGYYDDERVQLVGHHNGRWDDDEKSAFRSAVENQRCRIRADACTFGIVVKVERLGKRGNKLMPFYYCPNPKKLRTVKGAE